MITLKVNEDLNPSKKEKIKIRIRMDFRGEEEIGRFFFGSKSSEYMAKKAREEQIELFKNVPIQGIDFEKFDASLDVYFIQEQDNKGRKKEVAYAPVLVTFTADSLEAVIPLLLNKALRKVEIISPENIILEKSVLEGLLYTFHKQITLVV